MRHLAARARRAAVEAATEPGNAPFLALVALAAYLVAVHGEVWPVFVFAAAGAYDTAVDQLHERRVQRARRALLERYGKTETEETTS